jgi:hypothetical protein
MMTRLLQLTTHLLYKTWPLGLQKLFPISDYAQRDLDEAQG